MMKDEIEADIRADRYYEWLDDQPKCKQCGKLWREEAGIYDENCDDYYCDQACVDEYESDRSEGYGCGISKGKGQSLRASARSGWHDS